ncbi:MAG: N-6 DNA methylase [Bacillota bacterium]|nr:N-6 DNA methylase [Bacillota bacterium]
MNGQTLPRELRSKLERTIQEAREISESAARAALEQLGVGETAPFKHLNSEERDLRVKLRAHGRQLGDRRNQDKGTQEIELLTEEVAYQHWHRMLFARFLAENDLLMYPDQENPVAVTLEECDELAVEFPEVRNGWELAARFATRILPQIFRLNSPVFKLNLPLEYHQKLERLLEELPTDVFLVSDSLGWVYQYWQSRRKEEVNKSGVKIGERELPAVTQLFTEPYMVSFLLDNALGAWWAARKLGEEDLKEAGSEEELREKASLPGVPLEYLRFVKDENGLWTPAAGTFDEWPEDLSEFKVMDTCCGSGHFLVAAFHMLVPMRMELEGLEPERSVDAVLEENLHGLEIDQRCVEIAAFALALNAWHYPGAGGYRKLPELNLACSGLSVSVPKEEWKKLANGDPNLRLALDVLYDYFQQAPVLGSLLDPAKSEASKLVEWPDLKESMQRALQKERSDEEYEAGVVASGLAKAGELLAGKYHWVITNVPYLARGKQNAKIKEYSTINYNDSKNDLATIFLERCLEFCSNGGSVSIVLPQNWLFQRSYNKLREKVLQKASWRLLIKLGAGAFETISGEVVKAILLIASQKKSEIGSYLYHNEEKKLMENVLHGFDTITSKTAKEKANELISSPIGYVKQKKLLDNPDSIITIEELSAKLLLKNYAIISEGLHTGDYPRFGKKFWEVRDIDPAWSYQQGGPTSYYYSGLEHVLYWQKGAGVLIRFVRERLGTKVVSQWIKGESVWGKKGVSVSSMSNLKPCFYLGALFTHGIYSIVPNKQEYRSAIAAFCNSTDFYDEVRKLNQNLCISRDCLENVTFNLEYWQKVAAEKYPHGLPKPFSDDPTQWIFHGHPCGSVVFNEQTGLLEHGPLRIDPTVLQVAVARLLGYRWPAELDQEMELSDESRYWVNKCEKLLPFVDQEGIVCITPVRGEAAAADRIIDLLAAAYGKDWNKEVLSKLLEQSDHAGKTLETWLRDKFFIQHCKLFHHRPFIWQIWDGLPDGFSALVNYHKLDRKNLETLTYTYLGDWIKRQKQDQLSGVDGTAGKLAAAENLQKKLELILEGESPYDIFVRWKPIEQQPIGWEPDLNDGVRMNIRPFMSVPPVRKKGAGVLRDKPNIKWTKDRGKDVSRAPWYNLFKGERINDHHLSLKEKKEARSAKHNYDMVAEDEHGE